MKAKTMTDCVKDAEKLPTGQPEQQDRYIAMEWKSFNGEPTAWIVLGNFRVMRNAQGAIVSAKSKFGAGTYEIHRLKCGGEE